MSIIPWVAMVVGAKDEKAKGYSERFLGVKYVVERIGGRRLSGGQGL
jgi:hypothetical protein